MTHHVIIYDTINGQSGLKDIYILVFPTAPFLHEKHHSEFVDNDLLVNVTKKK